ncbi:MAG TPA: protease pro-enzyme activation domain-containing protein [Acidimicrobiales bacterium]|nr:protease pro-enzyme activation domain-containing protein [Acidimicrobiales bacterium]
MSLLKVRRRPPQGRAVVAGTLLAGAAAVVAPLGPQSSPGSTVGGAGMLEVVAPATVAPLSAVALGALPPHEELSAEIVLEPRDPAGLARLAAAVSAPGSPSRGRYLTMYELRKRFGSTAAELYQVEAVLRERGLGIRGVSADGLTVEVAATAAEMAAALSTSFRQVRVAGGRLAYYNSEPARLPASVGAHVAEVLGLSDLPEVRPLLAPPGRGVAAPNQELGHLVTGAASGTRSQPCWQALLTARDGGGLVAGQLAAAYGMTGLYSAGDLGAGSTVGIEEFEPNWRSDVSSYETCYGIHTQVSYVKVDGGPRPATGPGSGETALDIEDVAGLAPAARVIVYQAPNSNRGFFDEMQWIVDHPSAEVVTTSWGQCEPELGSTASGSYSLAAARRAARAEDTLLELAAAEGQSWIAAAGDDGSTDCIGSGPFAPAGLTVDDPGSQPYVTSVGGTTLRVRAHVERVWNNASGAGGGGQSQLWPMPAYQAGAPSSLGVVGTHSSGMSCHAAAGYCREVPDVAADANPVTGYVVDYGGVWQSIGGTSAAAPLWAAAVALTDASRLCGGSSLGFLDPSLYALAGSPAYHDDFTDIVRGDNDFAASGYGGGLYPAEPGYDMASGLGSPRLTSAGGSGGLAPSLCRLGPGAPPGIDRISPASGPAAGGSVVTIYGYGFTAITGVYFGRQRAAYTLGTIVRRSPTWIRATVPPGSGTVYVRVRTRHGPSPRTPTSRYTYT